MYSLSTPNCFYNKNTVIYDVIVIGLGAMGSATLYHLTKSKLKVLGIEQYHTPHQWGSSNVKTETRLTRTAIGEGSQYVKLAQRSHQLWRQLEDEMGLNHGDIYKPTGGLMIARQFSEKIVRGNINNFVEATRRAAVTHNIPHRIFSAKQLKKAFPKLKNIREDEIAYYDETLGSLDIKNCLQAQLSMAKKQGAVINFNEKVKHFYSLDCKKHDLLCVMTNKSQYYAKKLVFALGPWIKKELTEMETAVTVTRQIIIWFKVLPEYRDYYAKFPVLYWGLDDYYFYITPSLNKEMIKVGIEYVNGADIDPDKVNRQVSEEEISRVFKMIKPRLPGVVNQCVKSEVCLLTSRQDGNFVIDYYPEKGGIKNKNIVVISACSGHGFKHSAAIGEGVAQQLVYNHCTLKLFDLFGDKWHAKDDTILPIISPDSFLRAKL